MSDAFDVETESEFHETLTSLVVAASENGVDVAGGWLVEDGRGRAWDLVITGLDGGEE